jgi:hypothetical protein
MDDTLTIVIITVAVCYILFTTYKNDYFTIQPQNSPYNHPPYNHSSNNHSSNNHPPYNHPPSNNHIEHKHNYYQEKDNMSEDIHTLNDIDDIINNYENINYNERNHIERNQNHIERNQFENRNISKYRKCDKNNNNNEVYINNERRNNRNNYATFKNKVYRNGVAYTSVDKLAEIRSDQYNNNIGQYGDAISNVYDNLLSTTYDK